MANNDTAECRELPNWNDTHIVHSQLVSAISVSVLYRILC